MTYSEKNSLSRKSAKLFCHGQVSVYSTLNFWISDVTSECPAINFCPNFSGISNDNFEVKVMNSKVIAV